ncbi:hydrolase, putative [Perkinsus marinus ATCC 50983]|uniref:Hydrolase, putative n=1 Tax=Perkinsus marinus (strain ATCC 50983 / TXsc) TaxID=423536 RepID=C5KXH9_PERM5|nr:hydrolase, putative [Perkinsus marinus ATCC 50983]EER10703.1 hydrolase, putative [Perkinsus marinus ATCC 50983]|eukprot:XP_002778908.1 hydrolase, putative [Perkinsus marinus ATCC 50983]
MPSATDSAISTGDPSLSAVHTRDSSSSSAILGSERATNGPRLYSRWRVSKSFRDIECPFPETNSVDGPYGCVSYQLLGTEHNTQELAICLHGLNGSKMLYSDLAQVLSRSRMVLTYDMYGHGLSNAPPVAHCTGAGKCCCQQRASYDLDFFVDQLYFLMDHLKLIDRDLIISLIGFSFGGAVAVSFADKNPELCQRLVLLSPAGFIPIKPFSYQLLHCCPCCIIPLAQHCVCSCIFARDKFVAQRACAIGDEPRTEAELEWQEMFWRRVVWQTLVKRDGISSSLAILDRVPFFDMTAEYSRVGEHPRPVLLVWGINDQVNPIEVASTVKRFFINVYLLRIQNAAHLTLCEQPIVTCSSILSFLNVPTDFRFQHGNQGVLPLQQEMMNDAVGASKPQSPGSALRVQLPHARDVFIPRHEGSTRHPECAFECDIETTINCGDTSIVHQGLAEGSPIASVSDGQPHNAEI